MQCCSSLKAIMSAICKPLPHIYLWCKIANTTRYTVCKCMWIWLVDVGQVCSLKTPHSYLSLYHFPNGLLFYDLGQWLSLLPLHCCLPWAFNTHPCIFTIFIDLFYFRHASRPTFLVFHLRLTLWNQSGNPEYRFTAIRYQFCWLIPS